MAWDDNCPPKELQGLTFAPSLSLLKFPIKSFILAKVAFIKNTFFLKVAARGLTMSWETSEFVVGNLEQWHLISIFQFAGCPWPWRAIRRPVQPPGGWCHSWWRNCPAGCCGGIGSHVSSASRIYHTNHRSTAAEIWRKIGGTIFLLLQAVVIYSEEKAVVSEFSDCIYFDKAGADAPKLCGLWLVVFDFHIGNALQRPPPVTKDLLLAAYFFILWQFSLIGTDISKTFTVDWHPFLFSEWKKVPMSVEYLMAQHA